MRFSRWLGLSAGAMLLVPAVALAIDLTSGGGFLFDIRDTSGGELSNGTSDAYDTAYSLRVDGTAYNVSGAASSTTLGGRNVVMASTTIGGLEVHREIWVPSTGGDYARFLDVVTNPGSSDASVTLEIRGNLGSDSGTVLYASSSGDTTFTTADTWFGTDDVDGSGDPSLAHVVQGTSPRVGASAASLSGDSFSWSFSTTIPAGERVALLTFAIQKNMRADAMSEATMLAEIPDEALTGLGDYLDDIINFSIAEPGAPRISFDGPFTLEEGASATVEITVEDLEGDTVTWSWDTDDDGSFGEMEGASSYTIPAGTTDGDGVVRVGVRASDGTLTTERYRSITVTNVAPTITSSPDTLTSVGASYRYQIEVDDPAGDLDPLSYAVTSGPSRMVVSDTGLVTWTPRETDVTPVDSPLHIAISVDDGDEGTDTQEWDLVVSPNRAPTPPSPIYPVGDIGLLDREPRLVASNAEDDDRDPLTYFFQIDRSESFDSEDLLESGPVDETPGYSFWYVSEPLPPGHYHWRVWVNDGTVDSETRSDSFFVVPDPDALPDAGPSTDGAVAADGGTTSTRERDGGCSVSPGAGPDPLALWLGILVVLGWRVGRRCSTKSFTDRWTAASASRRRITAEE